MNSIDEATNALNALQGYRVGDCPTLIGSLACLLCVSISIAEHIFTMLFLFCALDVRYRPARDRRRLSSTSLDGDTTPRSLLSLFASPLSMSPPPLTPPRALSPELNASAERASLHWSPFQSAFGGFDAVRDDGITTSEHRLSRHYILVSLVCRRTTLNHRCCFFFSRRVSQREEIKHEQARR